MPHSFPNHLPNCFSHNNRNEHPLGCFSRHLAWNMCSMILVLYFLLGFLTRAIIVGYLKNHFLKELVFLTTFGNKM